MTVLRLLAGIGVGTGLAWLGSRRRLLTRSGTLAVGLILALVWAVVGWAWGIVMGIYWLGLALVAPFRRCDKSALSERFDPARARLGWREVLARMAWATLLALNAALGASSAPLLAAYAGAIAASGADAFGTELGILSAQRPRLIVSWQPTPAGTAGAISVIGLVAALGASWLIGLTALVAQAAVAWQGKELTPRVLLWLPLAAMVGGTLASLVDSLLGATAQAIYYCPSCDQRTEHPVHACGSPAEPVRGWPWMNNYVINLVCSIVGAAITTALAQWLAG
jgi:uncharacterized protein (TIGR00297 family)